MARPLRPPASAPRSWHEWYARSFGYFWIPCPLCSGYFGGHEWLTDSDLPGSIPDPASGPGISTAICPACTRAGRGVLNTTYANVQPEGEESDA